MKAAVLVIDMVKDIFRDSHHFPITPLAIKIIPSINEITSWARQHYFPVVFACDSFYPDDFIFKGRMKPHSLQGTEGSEPIDELNRTVHDQVLPKPRFSAFFKTDLAKNLRIQRVDTVIVCGIATHVCVLATVLDALSHDFKTIIVEDATTSYNEKIHRQTIKLYYNTPIFPLLRVARAEEILGGLLAT